MELELSEEEEDETEEQKAERAARRLKREVDMLHAKLARLKEKETNAKSERKSLRDAMKKNHQLLKYAHCYAHFADQIISFQSLLDRKRKHLKSYRRKLRKWQR